MEVSDGGSVPPGAQRGGGGVLLSDEDLLDDSAIIQLSTANRRQLRPYEFAKVGRFSYANKITDKNITIPLCHGLPATCCGSVEGCSL